MKELIYNKIQAYNPSLKDFEISYSNHSLIVDELITLYEGRNKLAKEKATKELTSSIFNDLCQIKRNLIEKVKMVSVQKEEMTLVFFFTEDYSTILLDYVFKNEENSK
ncbi:hypothetical protein [Chryseobacterium sp. LAM-KRS1]|uniref:hypothetical protein n=1 Tax=Chryseobacterium sp. LAM-KRS1 TaxID=2715754 RepID=UPI001553DF65|nr:hypothetical protein [Chryseobacterium sp. LAM-KRS1]